MTWNPPAAIPTHPSTIAFPRRFRSNALRFLPSPRQGLHDVRHAVRLTRRESCREYPSNLHLKIAAEEEPPEPSADNCSGSAGVRRVARMLAQLSVAGARRQIPCPLAFRSDRTAPMTE